MENQHRKISGYRELSQEEIDLMNRVKSLGPELDQLVSDINAYLEKQFGAAAVAIEDAEIKRLIAAEPNKWMEMGKADLQKGLMALTRAIAQPTFF